MAAALAVVLRTLACNWAVLLALVGATGGTLLLKTAFAGHSGVARPAIEFSDVNPSRAFGSGTLALSACLYSEQASSGWLVLERKSPKSR